MEKACLATARFFKMYQCQYRCEVDSNTCIYPGDFSCSQNSDSIILPFHLYSTNNSYFMLFLFYLQYLRFHFFSQMFED